MPWTVAANWIFPPAVVAAGFGDTAIDATAAVVAALSVSDCAGAIPTHPDKIEAAKTMAAEMIAAPFILRPELFSIELA